MSLFEAFKQALKVVFKFDSKNYLKFSPRTQIEVYDEVVEAGEVLYIPSGTEVAFNNLTVKGKFIVAGKCIILKELDVINEVDVIGELDVMK